MALNNEEIKIQKEADAFAGNKAVAEQIGGKHYESKAIQPIEYIEANNLPFAEGNVVKYVTRHASKNGLEDIEKAIWYLERIKKVKYNA